MVDRNLISKSQERAKIKQKVYFIDTEFCQMSVSGLCCWVGDSGLCCFVQCLLSTIISLCLLSLHSGSRPHSVADYNNSVASRLWNCRNPAKCIYWLHKWKASVPICPQKMRMGRMFHQPKRPFYFFFCITTRRYLCDFLLLVSCS